MIRKLFFILIIVFYISQSTAFSIKVKVPEKYSEVKAGERFYFETEIKFPENKEKVDIKLHYKILKDDELIAEAKMIKAIGVQASYLDFIVIPKNTQNGLHKIEVTVTDYKNLKKTASASFYVTSDKEDQIRLYFFIIMGSIVFVGLLVVFDIFMVRRRLKR